MSKPGKFITFEGGEGVGKSTNIQWCAEWLMAQGVEVLVTREPGGTPIAELIRNKLLKAHHAEPMMPMTELLLMFAARAQHLQAVIEPALQNGIWVLCDRFTDSTIAYQGFGRGLELETIDTLKQLAQGNLEPDCTFLLDAPVSVGMSRARGRSIETGEQTDRFETEALAFFERVRDGFHTLAATHSRFVIIDAEQPLERVQSELAVSLEVLRGA
ncbi:dTMP kinase [Oceanobacter mangrovi]|uniref:dTMP kinase n=1 Tax=Oceanobacter mangrovi TaxID=2862510 RepID=UPI001C8D0E1B|nr:dTMP kinase [Oceanobacter mangrovi]